MNVSLTPQLEAIVRRKVASGLYNNASEVIREALRLLVAREESAVPNKHEVRARIAALEQPLREKGITSLAVFGSIVRGEARPDSDVDILIDTDPESRFSLVDLISVKNLLEEHLERGVDVVTKQGIDPAIRDRVFRESERVF